MAAFPAMTRDDDDDPGAGDLVSAHSRFGVPAVFRPRRGYREDF
jgi:hypothetical protein